VESTRVLHSGKLQSCLEIIDMWNILAVANTLTYYDMATIMTITSFIVQLGAWVSIYKTNFNVFITYCITMFFWKIGIYKTLLRKIIFIHKKVS